MQIALSRTLDNPGGAYQGWSRLCVVDKEFSGIAWADVQPDYDYDEAWIWSVQVTERLRGKKFGELIVIYAILEASRRGQKRVGLNVYSDNKIARKLYEKLGFEYDPNYRYGGAMTMRMELTPEKIRELKNRRRVLRRAIWKI